MPPKKQPQTGIPILDVIGYIIITIFTTSAVSVTPETGDSRMLTFIFGFVVKLIAAFLPIGFLEYIRRRNR